MARKLSEQRIETIRKIKSKKNARLKRKRLANKKKKGV